MNGRQHGHSCLFGQESIFVCGKCYNKPSFWTPINIVIFVLFLLFSDNKKCNTHLASWSIVSGFPRLRLTLLLGSQLFYSSKTSDLTGTRDLRKNWKWTQAIHQFINRKALTEYNAGIWSHLSRDCSSLHPPPLSQAVLSRSALVPDALWSIDPPHIIGLCRMQTSYPHPDD